MKSCGFRSSCGRHPGHPGQHGGWHTGVEAVVPGAVPREWDEKPLGAQLTPTELRVLAEAFIHGSYREVADCLGMREHTVSSHASSIITKTGATTVRQVALLLGWVSLPRGVAVHELRAAS